MFNYKLINLRKKYLKIYFTNNYKNLKFIKFVIFIKINLIFINFILYSL